MREELQKKVDRAIRLIRSAVGGGGKLRSLFPGVRIVMLSLSW